jgi:penicillin-binding protein 1A
MKRFKRLVRKSFIIGMALFGAGLLGTLVMFIVIAPGLPSIESLKDVQLQVPLRVYTKEGDLISEYGEKRRAPLSYDEFPPSMIQAMMAAEDARFFEHPGVDYQGILRAAISLIRTGKKSQGGSTITMQVARNFFLSSEKTYLRKINEIFLSFKIEWELSKKEIMELYLNKIYLGHRAYGVASAAQAYYGKELNQLNLAQIAMIAGLPKAPSRYNPIANPSRATARRNYVLGRMRDLGFIDEATYDTARSFHDDAEPHSLTIEAEAPYVGEMVRAEMVDRFGDEAYRNGYKVYTTVSTHLQEAANHSLRQALIDYNKRHGYRGPIKHVDMNMTPGSEEWIRVLSEKKPLQEKLKEKGPVGQLFNQYLEFGNLSLAQQDWDRELKNIPSVGNLVPALVSGLEEKTANVLLVDGRLVRIDWDGLKWAARYESDVATGPYPRDAKDVLNVGDIVYVFKDEADHWELNQVPEAEGALISLKPQDGAIQAMVGGFDFYQSKFNRVLQAERQPGSNFKPFLYSAALEKGYTAASIINDAPITKEDAALEGVWRPENYENRYRGPTRLRVALTKSINTVAVRLLESIGVRFAIKHASRFGIPVTHLQKDLSLALGSGTVTPLELATGYSVFANGGYRIFPYVIERIEDMDGKVIYQANPVKVCPECLDEENSLTNAPADGETPDQLQDDNIEGGGLQNLKLEPVIANGKDDKESQQGPEAQLVEGESELNQELPPPIYPAERAISPQNAYIMTSLMQDVIHYGTGRRAWWSLHRRDIAGKTGTTNDQQDAWFSGFNSNVVTTTWVGFDKPRPLGDKETGSRAALPMWIDYMRVALDGMPQVQPQQPPGMVTVRIDSETGKLAGADDPHAMYETFREQNVPKQESPSDKQYRYAEDGKTDKPAAGSDNNSMSQQLF